MSKVIDISRELNHDIPVWPGSKPFSRTILNSFEAGGHFCESEFSMNIHTGTHMDAPSHFVKDGKTISELDLNDLIRSVQVIDVKELDVIDVAFLEKINLQRDAVIFKTKNSFNKRLDFDENFVALTSDAAKYLVDKAIVFVGVDGHSVQRFKDLTPLTHTTLLGNAVIVIEGLYLENVDAGFYQFIGLPLKVKDAEGAPMRAILIEEGK